LPPQASGFQAFGDAPRAPESDGEIPRKPKGKFMWSSYEQPPPAAPRTILLSERGAHGGKP